MSAYSDELVLLWVLALNGLVLAGAYRLARRARRAGVVAAAADALLLYFLTQYAAVALPGVCGCFNAWTMTITAVALTAAMEWIGRQVFDPSAPPAASIQWWNGDRLGLLAAALFTAGYLGHHAYVQSAAPPVATDGLVYHLPTAVQWIQTHRLGIYPTWYWNPAASYSPATSSTFMAWWMAPSGNDLFVRYVQLPPLILIFLLVVEMGRAMGCSRASAGCVAAAVTLCRPFFSEAVFAKDDLYVTAFTLAAVAALARLALEKRIDAPQSSRPAAVDVFRVGVAVGFLLASKYTALLMAPIFLFVIDSPFRARWRARQWLFAAGIVLVMAGPWPLRNILLTGNPLYPVDVHLGPLKLPGLFGVERDTQLRTAAGAWRMFTQTYHSLPAALIAVALLGWLSALVCAGRSGWTDPPRRVCLFGTPFTLAAFLLFSPHHEIRYLFPLIALLLTAGAITLAFIERRLGAMPAAAVGVLLLAVAVLTSLSFELIGTTLVLAAFGLATAGLGVAAVVAQTRSLHLSSRALSRAALAGLVLLCGAIYIEWHAYVQAYSASRLLAWEQPSGYPRLAPIWSWVDENTPADASIAYANTFFVYPYQGFGLTRRVAYAPVRRGLRDFARFPRMGDRVGGDFIVRRMTEVMNADPDFDTWLQNLRALKATYLVVIKPDPDTPDLSPNPPELRFARDHSAIFTLLHDTEAGSVFSVTSR